MSERQNVYYMAGSGGTYDRAAAPPHLVPHITEYEAQVSAGLQADVGVQKTDVPLYEIRDYYADLALTPAPLVVFEPTTALMSNRGFVSRDRKTAVAAHDQVKGMMQDLRTSHRT
jgi:hypothetical protein